MAILRLFWHVLFLISVGIKNEKGMRIVAWCMLLIAILFAAVSNRLEDARKEVKPAASLSYLP